MAKDTTFEIRAGHGQQLGANYDGKGVNFALFSAHAERVELCLFDPSGKTEIARLELPEPKTGEEIELPLEKLSTKKGTGAVYQLRFPKIGRYELVFRMSSTLGPLAQLPISVFLNNTLQQTVTINGTEGKIVEQTVILAIRQDGEKYMKLYFGESGIDMSRMFLRYVGKNDIESFRNE